MGFNAFIDIAIGLVLMYLVLSVFCTVINEIIATALKLRASSLESGIQELIDNRTLRDDFYNHGLISGTKGISTAGSKPSHPSYLSGKLFAMALLGSLDPTKPVPGFADVESAIKHLPDSNVRDALLAHVGAADKNLTQLRDEIASWFDQSMDRLGGVYKRKAKLITFITALFLVLATNADTVSVAKALWRDSALREGIVKAAEQVSSSGAPAASSSSATITSSLDDLSKVEQSMRPLPLGWSAQAAAFKLLSVDALLKLFGLLLTTVALTLGAPFWFDLLSKFIRVRGTGDKPARTEAS